MEPNVGDIMAERCQIYFADKQKLLGEFLGLTDNILQALEGQQEDSVIGYLEARQRIIAKVDKLDNEAEKIMSIGEREIVLEQIQDLFKDLISKDRHVSELAKKRKQDLGSWLRKFVDGKKLSDVYLKAAPVNEGIFVDFKK